MSNFHLSLEVFPPKKEADFNNAFETLKKMSVLNPSFISVTYGAGGSNSKKTVEIASYIENELKIQSFAHLTCVGNTKENINQVLVELKKVGVKNILALRGDRPNYMTDEEFNSCEFSHATDLIQYINRDKDFRLAAACYPEKHFESPSLEHDLNIMKEKADLGIDLFISQLFFENDIFYRFLEKVENKGIKSAVCAGIMPITTSKQLGTTVSLSGSSVPKNLADLIAKYDGNPEDMRKAGIEYAINQILDLKKHGHNEIHLYSMNKAKATAEIVEAVI